MADPVPTIVEEAREGVAQGAAIPESAVEAATTSTVVELTETDTTGGLGG